MTRALTLAAFACLALSVLALGRRPGSTVPTVGELLTLAMRSPVGRAATLASWVWLGWHLFAR